MSYAIVECEKKKIFNVIKTEEILNELHIKLPTFKEKKSQKFAKKVCKILKKHKVSSVVLSNELNENNVFKNVIHMNNNYIVTGNRMYVALTRKIIFDICKIIDTQIETVNVSILSHEFSIENLDLVKYISKSVKHLTIVTENKKRFENMLEPLFQEDGIVITVLKNENCNIKRSQFIINVDYTEEEIKKLILSKESIIISVKSKIFNLRKNFSRIIINDLDIYLGKEIFNFRTLSLCEAYIYDYKKRANDNEKIFEKSEYKINGYIGVEGKISEEEFKKLSKAFTKKSKNNA